MKTINKALKHYAQTKAEDQAERDKIMLIFKTLKNELERQEIEEKKMKEFFEQQRLPF